MQVLYIDPFAGASGDMFLGALVDLGVDFDALRDALQSMNISGFDLTRTHVTRHAIAATKVDVVVRDEPHPHRHLADLVKIVENAGFSEPVRGNAIACLTRLAEAEAAAHNMPIEKVHLHEVGGLDCLVDIVGSVWAIHALGVDRILSAPVTLGSGFQQCAHGVMPVPVPGTLAILLGFPVRRTQIPHEMTTPTGASLIATLAEPVTSPIVLTPQRIGHGAGGRDTHDVANFLRLVLARADRRHLPPQACVGHQPDSHHHDHKHSHHEHGHSHPHHGHVHSHSSEPSHKSS